MNKLEYTCIYKQIFCKYSLDCEATHKLGYSFVEEKLHLPHTVLGHFPFIAFMQGIFLIKITLTYIQHNTIFHDILPGYCDLFSENLSRKKICDVKKGFGEISAGTEVHKD